MELFWFQLKILLHKRLVERTDDINKEEETRLLAEQKAAKNPAKKDNKHSKFKHVVKQQQQQQLKDQQDLGGGGKQNKGDTYVMKCDLKSLHEAYQFLTRKYGIKTREAENEVPVEEFKIDLNGDVVAKKVDKDEKSQEEIELEQALQVNPLNRK